MRFTFATVDDCPQLAELNHQLIQDEGHRNQMGVDELEERMRQWLSGEYRAVVFEDRRRVVAYALFRETTEELYLRQLFVARDRRREGIGRSAVAILRSQLWPSNKRLTVDVLVTNDHAVTFCRAVGYVDYSLTLEVAPKRP